MSWPVSVLGAGIMGAGIAVVLAEAGHEVRLFDTRPEVAEAVASRHPGIEAYADLAGAVTGTTLVLEAVVEDLAVKHALYAEVERHAGDAPIASNTSSLVPSVLAAGLQDPGRLVIVHFFNPADVVPLVEVVPSPATRPEIVDDVVALLRAAGKLVVPLAREVPGFVANRLQAALVREALHLVREGVATPELVDTVVTGGLGPRWAAAGPFSVLDLGGLDTWRSLTAVIFPDLADDDAAPPELVAAVESGDLGAKTGRGFHEHTPEGDERTRAAVRRAFVRD
ncbi:3-hydroxyacyl-CoA dehydrogenase family protein [Nocardioides zeae]|uniref:3-hydroxyacyl-CoA dehydrogenase family protein n=1 Tax=Nocardioides imazamoxiresistens TaxID=3231893 RepID=A0ABU3PY39_9ACTN|nr:3-hydroxyacyl-CoA dehydrogenase family protein [Nocardioides zeae]MDT9594074.1 3-hydroxyacyl-CoA dehydrogenase family protein [Nocardioides zeae]